MTIECQCHVMPINKTYVLHLSRTGLVTAPCSSISHLRSDNSTLSISHIHALVRHAMESGSYIWSKLPAVNSSSCAPSSRTKSSLASSHFFHQASRECIRSPQFSSSKQVRSCCYRQRKRNEGNRASVFFVRVSHLHLG